VRAANVQAVGYCGGMTIELTTPGAAHALADYLRRCDCNVIFFDDLVLEVSPPERSQTPHQARIELNAYLRVWQALNPTEAVTVRHEEDSPS
jgi:hypothetical protein